MSKRYGRRPRNPDLPAEAFNNPISSSEAAADAAPASRTSSAPIAKTMNWRNEYNEVIGDLTKTAIIFVGLVVAMVVLSFVIR